MGSCPVVGRGFPHPNEELTPEWLIVCKLLASKTLRKVSLGQKIAPCELADAMDIQRPSNARAKKIRRITYGTVRLVLVGGVTYGLSKLRPAPPPLCAGTDPACFLC